MSTEPVWLVVVHRDRPDLYTWLRRQLGPQAEVVLDRRSGGDEAAGRDRRRPLTAAAATFWNQCGYYVVRRHAKPGPGALLATPAFIAAIAARLATPIPAGSRFRRLA